MLTETNSLIWAGKDAVALHSLLPPTRRPDVRLQRLGHLAQGAFLAFERFGGDAVLGHPDRIAAQVGVHGAEEHAAVGSDAGDHQALAFQRLQQQVQRGGVEGGMARLEDGEVALAGAKHLGDLGAFGA